MVRVRQGSLSLCAARPTLAAPLRPARAELDGQTLVLEMAADFVPYRLGADFVPRVIGRADADRMYQDFWEFSGLGATP